MKIVDNYLNYLNEQIPLVAPALKFIKGSLKTSFVSVLGWSVALPAAKVAWKLANYSFSNAARKCRSLQTSGPGLKVCISREKIKSLQEKIKLCNSMMLNCNKTKDEARCKASFLLEIEKAKNRIKIEKEKIEEILGVQEQTIVQEVSLSGAADSAIFVIAGMVVDKALFLANRTAQVLFNSAYKKCGVYKTGPEREECVSRIKLDSLTKQLNVWSTIQNTCNKQKDQKYCINRSRQKIEELKKKIEIQNDNITAYRRESELAKREEQMKKEMRNQ